MILQIIRQLHGLAVAARAAVAGTTILFSHDQGLVRPIGICADGRSGCTGGSNRT
jgi:hypothetical protein